MSDLNTLLEELTCGQDERAEQAVPALVACSEQALPELLELANAPTPETRWWALRTLAEIESPVAAQRLASALDDPSPEVRQCAALGLGQQPTGEATPRLLELLADPDRLLARLAGDALIATHQAAVPGLIEVLANGHPAARIEAARALAWISDPRAIGPLFEAWQEGSALLQHWAEEGLDRMGVGMQFFKPD
jgi:HEAT repeat protein